MKGIPSSDIQEWNNQIEHAENVQMKDRSVMDIMGAQRPQQGEAADMPGSNNEPGSVTEWIQLAIDIEEKQ